ncbi:hypothetical protein SAMN03159343_0586 [Klenkia marina]|uniref:Uncharacterized protein n=1 Tax=Klenkia marina TaxID=1960309 RepID=A0A1G4XDM2_9ACTN|nr:hypothetical protein SAMN03159343_0586 [Klenkia marina]
MDAVWGPGAEAELAYRREQVVRTARRRRPARGRWPFGRR